MVLFMGFFGVGKILGVCWVVCEFGFLFMIFDLFVVMSSYFGCIGFNLRYVLDYVKFIDCVFLFDELDVIVKCCDDFGEIGEFKCLVMVLF